MALRYADSFDGYTTLSERWTTASGTITAAAARTGAAGLRDPANQALTKTIDAQGTWIVGFAYRVAVLDGSVILRTGDTDVVANCQGRVIVNADGTIALHRGDGTTLLATSTLSLLPNVFYYIEVKHIILNAGGTFEVRVNGAVWVTFTGDTQHTANATANIINLNSSSGQTEDFDDLYINDGQGSVNNDYLGEVQIEYLACNADGNSEQWTPSAGSNFQNVDEAAPDDDTTYNSPSTEGNKDTFGIANISLAAATIPAIQVIIRARKESAGTANIQRVYRSGGSENNGASFNPSTSYATQLEIMETDPIAVGAWTIANLNASEFGYAAVA